MQKDSFSRYLKYKKAYLVGQYRIFLKGSSDLYLSSAERSLLLTRWLIYQSKLNEAYVCLQRMGTPSEKYLQAEASFLLGTILTKQGSWLKALECFTQAEKVYATISADSSEILRARYNQFVCLSRLGRQDEAQEIMLSLSSLVSNAQEEALILKAQALHFARLEQKQQALELVEQIQKIKFDDQVEMMNTLAVAVDVYARLDEYTSARRLILKLLLKKNRRLTMRLRFDLVLLQFLSEGHKIPPTLQKYSSHREYFLKWNVLYSLQSGYKDQAAQYWQQLVDLFPQQFAENFKHLQPSERNSIFCRALQSLLEKTNVSQSFDTALLTPKQRKLVEILSEQKFLNRKEIIEKIWGVEYSSDYDSRFYKLIERSKALGLHIVNEGHAYRLA